MFVEKYSVFFTCEFFTLQQLVVVTEINSIHAFIVDTTGNYSVIGKIT